MDYAGLQSAIASWSNRDDLTAQLPQFIEFAEARINRDLRHFGMENRAQATCTGPYFPLPCDWLQTIRVVCDGEPLRLIDGVTMERMVAAGAGGTKTKYYRHSERNLQLYPVPNNATITMEYIGKVPPLSDAEPENWLLTEFPDIYLYACLMQVASFLADTEQLGVWGQGYGEAVLQANKSSTISEWSGTGLKVYSRGMP